MADKKPQRRHVVQALLETEGGEWREFSSRPLLEGQKAETVAYLREAGARNITSHTRRYTDGELEDADRLSRMGRETSHLGVVE